MKFETWFKQQFGKLPLSSRTHNRMLDESKRLEERLRNIKRELIEDERIIEQWTAALYAKNAFGQSKEQS